MDNIDCIREELRGYMMATYDSEQRIIEFLRVNDLRSLDDCLNVHEIQAVLVRENMIQRNVDSGVVDERN